MSTTISPEFGLFLSAEFGSPPGAPSYGCAGSIWDGAVQLKEFRLLGDGRHSGRQGGGRVQRLDAGICLGVCLGIALTACAHATGDPVATSGLLTLPDACSAPRFYFGNLGNGWERTVIAFDCPRSATSGEDK